MVGSQGNPPAARPPGKNNANSTIKTPVLVPPGTSPSTATGPFRRRGGTRPLQRKSLPAAANSKCAHTEAKKRHFRHQRVSAGAVRWTQSP